MVTVDEQREVYDSIKQVIKDVGRPIALIDAIRIAASKDPKVRDYFGFDDTLSEEDRCLWSLIYEIVSEGPNRRSRGIQSLSMRSPNGSQTELYTSANSSMYLLASYIVFSFINPTGTVRFLVFFL